MTKPTGSSGDQRPSRNYFQLVTLPAIDAFYTEYNLCYLMAVFPSKKYASSAQANTFAARYRSAMAKHPFLLFGLPFLSVMIAGSFVLTPATAIRYERHDRKVRQMTRDEELGVGKAGRKVDIRDEYYVGFCLPRLALVADGGCGVVWRADGVLTVWLSWPGPPLPTETCREGPG